MLGKRLHQARQASGLSQRALADNVGVSAMMISKYERAQSFPSSDVLLALANALGVRTEYFFRTASVNLERIQHRNRHVWKLPRSAEKNVLADVRDQLERWMALDEITPAPWSIPFTLPDDLPDHIEELDAIESIATRMRHHWDLGLNPIPDLIDTLESRGLKVFTTKFDDPRFEGMSAMAGDQCIIVVGRNWPGDRQRFTLTHELGHIVLDERLATHVDKEDAANRFAGAFLVPQEKVFEVLGNHRRSLEFPELYLLKHEFGLSMGDWSYRALNTGVISKAAHRAFWQEFVHKGWKEKEPGEQYPPESPRLFDQTVYRTLSEGLIGESKAAELLAITAHKLAARRRMEIIDGDTGE